MNKSLSSYKLEFGIACCFDILVGIWHIGTFTLYFAQSSLKLERLVFKIRILWCRTHSCSWRLSVKVSLMLNNPFPVPFICKLKHTSVHLIPTLREKCPNTEFFLVRIFPHWNWIRTDTEYLSVFSLNAVRYGPEKTQYLDTLHDVRRAWKPPANSWFPSERAIFFQKQSPIFWTVC